MLARPGDAIGPGRQAAVAVRVVRRVDLEIAVQHARAMLADGVLHRRVGLERHPLTQPVVVDGGDHGPLLREPRFLLDDRRQRHDLVPREPELAAARASHAGSQTSSNRRTMSRTASRADVPYMNRYVSGKR